MSLGFKRLINDDDDDMMTIMMMMMMMMMMMTIGIVWRNYRKPLKTSARTVDYPSLKPSPAASSAAKFALL